MTTVSDRATAGAAYTSALDTLLTAYVELNATERALLRQGIDPPGGHFGTELGDIDLRAFRHLVYAPVVDQQRLEDRVTTRAAQL
jgi:hypothetical protein